MKIKEYGYAYSVNRGIEIFHSNPSRSIWVSRFYDQDVFTDKIRRIEDHAEDLYTLCKTIPARLRQPGVDLGENDCDYKVILIAHSMGGLVCRTLIQNIMPNRGPEAKDPKDWIYRFVTWERCIAALISAASPTRSRTSSRRGLIRSMPVSSRKIGCVTILSQAQSMTFTALATHRFAHFSGKTLPLHHWE